MPISNLDAALGRRLRAAMIESGVDSEQMAQLVGRGVETVRRYMRGEPAPKLVIEKWAEVTGRNPDYLKTGKGESLSTTGAGADQPKTVPHSGFDLLASDARMRARHRIGEAEIERAKGIIVPWLSAELRGIAHRLKAAPQPQRSPSQTKAAMLKRLDQAEQRATRLYVDGVLSRNALDQELQRLRMSREALISESGPTPPHVTDSQLRDVARGLEEHWRGWSPESKRELLQAMVEHIVLDFADPAASEIIWRHA